MDVEMGEEEEEEEEEDEGKAGNGGQTTKAKRSRCGQTCAPSSNLSLATDGVQVACRLRVRFCAWSYLLLPCFYVFAFSKVTLAYMLECKAW